MNLIISGTDRKGSNSRRISNFVKTLFEKNGEAVHILDLAELKPTSLDGPFYGMPTPEPLTKAIDLIAKADSIYFVVPEYNGSMPGVLKYFVDHWKYPESFEFRPMAFCGIGGLFGGLRPVEHLQGVMGYRNAFMYPERIFIREVYKLLKDGDKPSDALIVDLLEKQVQGFVAFKKALKGAKLDANSRVRN